MRSADTFSATETFISWFTATPSTFLASSIKPSSRIALLHARLSSRRTASGGATISSPKRAAPVGRNAHGMVLVYAETHKACVTTFADKKGARVKVSLELALGALASSLDIVEINVGAF